MESFHVHLCAITADHQLLIITLVLKENIVKHLFLTFFHYYYIKTLMYTSLFLVICHPSGLLHLYEYVYTIQYCLPCYPPHNCHRTYICWLHNNLLFHTFACYKFGQSFIPCTLAVIFILNLQTLK